MKVNIKISSVLKISILFLIVCSCGKNKEERIKNVFSDGGSKKWYRYSIDSIHCLQGFYPTRVFEFFKDGKQIQYINNFTTKNLDTIPEDGMYNSGRWFIINDSVVSISSVRNPKNGYYHKYNSKILYYNKDTIILQETKGISLLTRYKKPDH